MESNPPHGWSQEDCDRVYSAAQDRAITELRAQLAAALKPINWHKPGEIPTCFNGYAWDSATKTLKPFRNEEEYWELRDPIIGVPMFNCWAYADEFERILPEWINK